MKGQSNDVHLTYKLVISLKLYIYVIPFIKNPVKKVEHISNLNLQVSHCVSFNNEIFDLLKKTEKISKHFLCKSNKIKTVDFHSVTKIPEISVI
jgi:hypothetical protein